VTLYRLDLEPDDVAAASLGYRVDLAPAPESLVTALLEHPTHPAALRLSILGASHAVTLVVEGRDTVTEEVSCRASSSGGGLPSVSALHPGPWGDHHLRGAVESLAPEAFARVVEELTALADSGPEVLAGRFPGAEGALTVVSAAADPAGWRWRTWHLYPAVDIDGAGAGGEVVTTVSRLELALTDSLTEVAS
jgi:hypothetical protein